jgi:hypothetical protein
MVSDTIDVSSTITTSYGSRFVRSCRNRLCEPGRQPSSRCRVEAGSAGRSASPAARSDSDSWATASCSRAAALPVGAASAIRGTVSKHSSSSAISRATVVVLPVPGPPAMTVTRPVEQAAAASRW